MSYIKYILLKNSFAFAFKLKGRLLSVPTVKLIAASLAAFIQNLLNKAAT